MTNKKSTKIIAGLGVVAALGAAFIPMTSYAAEQANVGGEVELAVTVGEGIAMTIRSNGDNTTYYSATSNDVANAFGLSNNTAFGTSSASMELANGTFSDKASSVVTVYTNNNAGYTLSVKDADYDTNLSSGTAFIPAIKDGYHQDGEEGSVELGGAASGVTASGWGYKTDGAYKGIQSYDVEVATKAAKSDAHGDATTITYGVAVANDQDAGLYTDTIVYTATVNNN